MRTTVSIDDHLLAEAKQVAARTGRSLGDIVDDALRVLFTPRGPQPPVVPELPVFGGGGLLPGVDLEDKDGLSALLDEDGDRRAAG